MGISRCASLLFVFVVSSGILIYRSHLQHSINVFNVIQQQKQIETSYKNRLEKSGKGENSTRQHNSLLNNYSKCDNCTKNPRSHKNSNNLEYSNRLTKQKVIWISMGLCFSKNTEMYGKRDYPYAEVTPLAIILWYHFFPDINVIIYLVYDENEIEDRRKLYEEQLKQTRVEIRWVKSGDMNCVSKSQLIRMWAFQEPMINDKDVIITVDVNLFVATPNILDPIYEYPDLKIWNYQWHRAAFVNTSIGETFNQNLISAESKGCNDL